MTFFTHFLLYLFKCFLSLDHLTVCLQLSLTMRQILNCYHVVHWLCPDSIPWEPSLMLVGTNSRAAFTCPRSENVLCLPEGKVYTKCQLLKCLAIQQGLLKVPDFCIPSITEGPLSQALSGYSRPHIGHLYN